MWKKKRFLNVILSSEETKILEFIKYNLFFMQILNWHNKKLMDVKIILKINPQQSKRHIQSGISISTRRWFRIIENKHVAYRGKDCIEKFCEFLREHRTKITNFKNWSY